MGTMTSADARKRLASKGIQISPRITHTRHSVEDDPARNFKSHGDFLIAVAQHPVDMPPKESTDPRLRFLATVGSDEQSTYSDSYGGFLVPEAFSPVGMLATPHDGDPFAGQTTQIQMPTNILPINYRVDKNHTTSVTGGLRVYRRAEADPLTSSRAQTGRLNLTASSQFGLTYATDDLVMDSAQTFVTVIQAGFRDEFGSALLNERLHGTGVGEWTGINKSAALIEVAKETGQAAATIVYQNIVNMAARCWGYNSAFWITNYNCLPQLLAAHSNGIPAVKESRDGVTALEVLGRPLWFNENMETLGTAGDLLLVNPSEYIEGTYAPLQSVESLEVRYIYNERAYKFWTRNDGSPWWDAPLTPKNGATLSPFVRLATRA